MNLDGFEKVEVIGNRPEEAPDDWLVFNVPRPLYGSIVKTGEWSSNSVTWIGDFVTGVHYAAVDPAPEDPAYNDPHMWIDENRKLDARIVTWVSKEEHLFRILTWFDEFYVPYVIEKYDVDVREEGYTILGIDQAYRRHSDTRVIGAWLKE